MRSTCAPGCPPERVDGVRDLWTAGGVLAAAGGAAAIASGIWLGVSLTPDTPTLGGSTVGGSSAGGGSVGSASLRVLVEF